MLTSEQFSRTRRLALQIAGIELVERHRELLHRRCARLGVREGGGFDDLLDAVESGDNEAGQRLIRLITTKFTGFFRHPRQFEAAAKAALNAAQQNGRTRLWSAGTATGEEAYSMAIKLIELIGPENPPVTILATDIDETALTMAQNGTYGRRAMNELDPVRRTRFFTECSPHEWSVHSAVRQLVEFRALNLANATWPVEGSFDVIFCRNVLMYLEESLRCSVLERMASLLSPEGLLILDPTEHPGQASDLFYQKQDSVYRLKSRLSQRRVPTVFAVPQRGGS
jgi:chemotaxis protein methyltransferase CheR